MNAPDPIRNDPPRTLADYQADLIKRFGSMPSPERLATLENRAMRERLGYAFQVINRYDQDHGTSDQVMEAVVGALTKPMTTGDIMTATGFAKSTVQRALAIAVTAGKARKREMRKAVTIWEGCA